MSKNVYSLVLTSEVINMIDDEACSLGISRSALINKILAEHVVCSIPEQRIQQIFDYMGSRLEKPFVILPQNSNMLFAARKSLRYKYNPSMKYQVELFTENNQYKGILKVIFRTQNQNLLDLLEIFFQFVCQEELKYFQRQNDFYLIEKGKFSRKIDLSQAKTEEEISQLIVTYINFLDRCIQFYFSNIEEETLFAQLDLAYKNYVRENHII